MPDYRRYWVPGGRYFFTVNLLERSNNDLLVTHFDILRQSVRLTKSERPFQVNAWVALPDHMHWIWTLRPGDDDVTIRWRLIKARFSRRLKKTEYRSSVRVSRGERGIWQRRFWEHVIRDEQDYAAHMNYIHINPLKHGHVKHVRDWPYSSFHYWVERGVYPREWAGGDHEETDAEERRGG